MAENKIPVLTEVYQPKPESKLARQENPTLGVTPELIARVAAHVRPRLEDEIRQSVLESINDEIRGDLVKFLRSEIEKTQNTIVTNTQNFVDKTKADLKTDLPNMYQASADLVHENLLEKFSTLQSEASSKLDAMLASKVEAALQAASTQIGAHAEALQVDTSAHIMQQINQEMENFKEKSLADHQAQLGRALKSLLQASSESGEHDLQQHLQTVQTELLAEHLVQLSELLNQSVELTLKPQLQALQAQVVSEHQAHLTETLNSLLQTTEENAEQKLQAYQEKLQANHQVQLEQATQTVLQAINQHIEESTQEQEDIMDTRVGSMQQETLAQLRATFGEQKTEIFNAAVTEYKSKFAEEMAAQSMLVRDQFLSQVNGDLPAVQEVLREHVEQMIATAMPTLENDLRKQLTTELHALLLKVKFVLPS